MNHGHRQRFVLVLGQRPEQRRSRHDAREARDHGAVDVVELDARIHILFAAYFEECGGERQQHGVVDARVSLVHIAVGHQLVSIPHTVAERVGVFAIQRRGHEHLPCCQRLHHERHLGEDWLEGHLVGTGVVFSVVGVGTAPDFLPVAKSVPVSIIQRGFGPVHRSFGVIEAIPIRIRIQGVNFPEDFVVIVDTVPVSVRVIRVGSQLSFLLVREAVSVRINRFFFCLFNVNNASHCFMNATVVAVVASSLEDMGEFLSAGQIP